MLKLMGKKIITIQHSKVLLKLKKIEVLLYVQLSSTARGLKFKLRDFPTFLKSGPGAC